MKNNRCAHALCFVGNTSTGQILKSSIGRSDVLDAVVIEQDDDVFEKLEDVKPVIVVIEDAPGKFDGIDIVHRIRNSKDYSNIEIPIILILSSGTARRAIDGSESGANQILTAPFTSGKLWECFELALNDTRRFVVTDEYTGPERRSDARKIRASSKKEFSGIGRRREDFR